VVTAYLPSLLTGVARRGDSPGWGFQLALEVMEALQAMRHEPGRGLSLGALAQRLRVDVLQLEEPVAAMVALDWVARLDEDGERYVLLIDPALIRITPLVERLLLARSAGTEAFWAHSGLSDMTVAQTIAANVAEPPPPLAHLG
jgi:membrane protein